MSSNKKCKTFFITGTDTEIGKTTAIQLLACYLRRQNYQVINCKPVACGGIFYENNFHNEDVLALQKLNSISLPYSTINPFLFNQPISPNIAASQNHLSLSAKEIAKKIYPLFELPVDFILVEGLGGWLVPINDHETMADVVQELAMPIIIVVGLRLGCLNHTLLTLESIRKSNLNIAGWIANSIDPHMLAMQDNIQTLQRWIEEPFLGYIPYSPYQLDDSFLNLKVIFE